MTTEQIEKNYAVAKARYAELGIDTDKAIEILGKTPISLHCWQADDVVGFERNDALSGGIQATGNYPGRARNLEEVRQDLEKVQRLLAGTFRVNLHETYGDFGGSFVDRDQVEPKYMTSSSTLTLLLSPIQRVATSLYLTPIRAFETSGSSIRSVADVLPTPWDNIRETPVS